jgi:histidyl-tRNA synthetase
MAMMMADVMEALGIARGDYVIRVNNRKVLDGVLEAIGLGGAENAGRRLTVLRAIDKLDKFGPEGVAQLLGNGRWDGGKEGEGDFTRGAGLDQDGIERVLAFSGAHPFNYTVPMQEPHNGLDDDFWVDVTTLPLPEGVAPPPGTMGYFDNEGVLRSWFALVGNSETGRQGIAELADINRIVRAAGYGSGRIRIDSSVVRGLEYYTGPVFEAELLAEIPNEEGQIVRFGSVGGGGRYDGLVSRFRGEPVPATGFSIGVSRLMTALKNLGKLDTSDVVGPVVVMVMDKDTDSLGRYQKMVTDLRRAGIRAEMYLGGAGMKAQMKYADRRNAPCVVIQGSDERAKAEVQIKDLIEGARLAQEITDNSEWREGRPAQFSVPESELVDAVRRVLAAQAAERGQG